MTTNVEMKEPTQMIVTLDQDAIIPDIKRAMRLMRGVLSIRMVRPKRAANAISPSLAQQMTQAREEYANGETISCNSPEEMQQYFDSL